MPRTTGLLRAGLIAALVAPAAWATARAAPFDSAAAEPWAGRRAVEPTADQGARSPGGALAIGIGTTLAPALLSLAVNPPGSDSDFAWEASLGTAAGVGIVFGPAIGLWSGGRGDLAGRGLRTRALGGLVTLASGVIALGMILDDDERGAAPVIVMIAVASAGGAIVLGSSAHDLVRTPAAVRAGPPARVGLGVTRDGRVALTARF